MENQVILIGRLVKEPEVIDNKTKINLGVKRPNSEEIDVIECILWNGVASATNEYCHTGDCLGIKGRLQIENGVQIVICEKVTKLSLKNEKEGENK